MSNAATDVIQSIPNNNHVLFDLGHQEGVTFPHFHSELLLVLLHLLDDYDDDEQADDAEQDLGLLEAALARRRSRLPRTEHVNVNVNVNVNKWKWMDPQVR